MPEFLCIDLNPQTEFSQQTKSFRKPTERSSSFTDLLLQPVARKQASYIKDTIDFVPFIENTHFQTTQSSLHSMSTYYIRISHRKKGSKSPVCKYYDEHYQPNPTIPASTLEDLMKLILKVNLFHFNGKHFL